MTVPTLWTVAAVLAVAAVPASAQQRTPANAPPSAVTVHEEKAGLLKEAKIAPADAIKTALARVPGATVKRAEIERENGRLVYSFDLVVAGTKGIEEVLVDATTGKVVSVEHEADGRGAPGPQG